MTLHPGENPYIYGLHDKGGEHLLIENGVAKGWVLVTEKIGADPNDRGGADYSDLAKQGLGVIVRLNHDYGANGTIPREALYPQFAQRCANFVAASRGAGIWLIGNEMNFEREQPRQPGSDKAEPITPRRYARAYKLCRQRIKAVSGHENDLVVVGAIGPWNGETPYEADPENKYPANIIADQFGDFIRYMHDMLVAIGPDDCDAIAIHAYSHGYKPEMVFDESKMGWPFENYYYNFYTYRDQMNAIPQNMRHLPVYLTEMNGDKEPGSNATWPFGNNGWIQNAYKELNSWNESGRQQIRCGILFRWKIDPLGWSIDGKPEVQQDLKQAMKHNYKWDPTASQADAKPKPPTETKPKPEPPPEPKPKPPTETIIPRPEVPGYRARYLSHNTPDSFKANQTLTITLSLANSGSFTWAQGGKNPFRLGSQWYNAAGDLVELPANLDFRTPLPKDIPPGQQVTLQARLQTPPQPGTYQLRWDMVHEMVTWFTSQGDAGLLISPATVSQPVVEPQPTPKPKPPTEPKPTPKPQPPKVEIVQIQNVAAQLEQHPTKRYVSRPLQAIKRIIIHHSGSPASISVQRIAEYQVKQVGLPGITYHYCTTVQGQAYQTQPLTVTAAHSGQDSRDSIGICLIGNFTEESPPEAQLDATASILAQLLPRLNLDIEQVIGRMEISSVQSPGATWPLWKGTLLEKTEALLERTTPPGPGPTPDRKPLAHYMLFWYRGPGNWAEWDVRGAMLYIEQFSPTVGFSVEEAQFAGHVTIVGGPGGVPAEAEQILRNAGCKVERIAGATETETRRILDEMAENNQRFIDPK